MSAMTQPCLGRQPDNAMLGRTVRNDDALGQAGGAGRIENEGGVLRIRAAEAPADLPLRRDRSSKSSAVPIAPSTLSSMPPAGNAAAAIAWARASSLRMIAPCDLALDDELGELGGLQAGHSSVLERPPAAAGPEWRRNARKNSEGSVATRLPACDAPRRESGCDRVDLGQQAAGRSACGRCGHRPEQGDPACARPRSTPGHMRFS